MSSKAPDDYRKKVLERYLDSPFGYPVYFREYSGPAPKVRLRKPIVGPPERPYPELQMVGRLEAEGWHAAWVYRGRKFLRTWEPREESVPPEDVRVLIDQLNQRAAPRGRCWPIVAWRNGDIRFVALLRQGVERRLSAGHRRWQEAALAAGVPEKAFQITHWLGGSFDGVWLTAMEFFQDKVRGWVRYGGQEPFVYGGEHPASVKQWVEGYRGDSGLSGADLLWVVFRDSTAGMTYWNITQEKVA